MQHFGLFKKRLLHKIRFSEIPISITKIEISSIAIFDIYPTAVRDEMV